VDRLLVREMTIAPPGLADGFLNGLIWFSKDGSTEQLARERHKKRDQLSRYENKP
jgi:hypothetical protein